LIPKGVIVKPAVRFVDVTGLLDGLVQQSHSRNHRFSVCSLSAIARAACDAPLSRASVALGLLDLDTFGHGFSPFLPRFSRGTQGQVAPAPCGCLGGGAKKISSVSLDFFGWDRPPKGSEAEAEPADRRAPEFLPACRARENKGARKGE
jgi:hypothetical protein